MRLFTTPIQLSIVLVLALALEVVPGASPAAKPLLQLGPITVLNGTAVVSGTVGPNPSDVKLTINGRPVGIDAAGAFHAVIALGRASSISLVLDELRANQRVTYTIPLTSALLGSGGVIPAGALDSLQQAGVSLLSAVFGPNGLTVKGSVLDRGKLVSLTLNGVDVLGLLLPNGAFSVQLPGTTTVITLTATDTTGASQKTTKRLIRRQSLGSVTAANAVGIRIAKIRFVRKGVLRTHRMRMIVTVKDLRGRVVSGARIMVRSTKAGRLSKRPRLHISGSKGRATFALPLGSRAYGKRLVIVTVARTPSAKARKRVATLVPRRTRAHR